MTHDAHSVSVPAISQKDKQDFALYLFVVFMLPVVYIWGDFQKSEHPSILLLLLVVWVVVMVQLCFFCKDRFFPEVKKQECEEESVLD